MIRRARDTGVKAAMRIVYGAIRLFSRTDRNKILLLSRHSNSETLDFRLLREELQRRRPEVRVVTIACRFEGGLRDAPRFGLALLRSLRHLASAKVCVLDSYWPGVSVLEHSPELVVYQLWHSLGKIKRTGKQALDQAQGRSAETARALRMHEGYDFVVAGAEVWNEHYRETFGVEAEQVLHLGLPRADYLLHRRDELAARIRAAYPVLSERPVVLYAPTFRRKSGKSMGARGLLTRIDAERYTLVVKKHKDDELDLPETGVLTCPEFTGFEMLAVADVVITDYSSIALEAALIEAPTFYYVYDYEEYLSGNGVNIDLFAEMPGCVFRDAGELCAALEQPYPADTLARYRQKFVLRDPGHSTADLADHILEAGGLCSH